MADLPNLLTRVVRALPRMRVWIEDLHATHSSAAVSVASLPFASIREYFPSSIVQQARAVSVGRVPFPPVSDFDLPEFEGMAQTERAGITFGNMYFLREDLAAAESLHIHELVHVVQWNELDVRDFLLTYALGLIQHGYLDAPLEKIAFEIEARFEAGERFTGPDVVAQHARSTRDAALDVYRGMGVRLD